MKRSQKAALVATAGVVALVAAGAHGELEAAG